MLITLGLKYFYQIGGGIVEELLEMVSNPYHFIMFYQTMAPAFLIHIWLILLALASLGVRILYSIFRAVEWAQWFLKQGNQHPLRAIGVVAAGLVFVGMVIERTLATVA